MVFEMVLSYVRCKSVQPLPSGIVFIKGNSGIFALGSFSFSSVLVYDNFVGVWYQTKGLADLIPKVCHANNINSPTKNL